MEDLEGFQGAPCSQKHILPVCILQCQLINWIVQLLESVLPLLFKYHSVIIALSTRLVQCLIFKECFIHKHTMASYLLVILQLITIADKYYRRENKNSFTITQIIMQLVDLRGKNNNEMMMW